MGFGVGGVPLALPLGGVNVSNLSNTIKEPCAAADTIMAHAAPSGAVLITPPPHRSLSDDLKDPSAMNMAVIVLAGLALGGLIGFALLRRGARAASGFPKSKNDTASTVSDGLSTQSNAASTVPADSAALPGAFLGGMPRPDHHAEEEPPAAVAVQEPIGLERLQARLAEAHPWQAWPQPLRPRLRRNAIDVGAASTF